MGCSSLSTCHEIIKEIQHHLSPTGKRDSLHMYSMSVCQMKRQFRQKIPADARNGGMHKLSELGAQWSGMRYLDKRPTGPREQEVATCRETPKRKMLQSNFEDGYRPRVARYMHIIEMFELCLKSWGLRRFGPCNGHGFQLHCCEMGYLHGFSMLANNGCLKFVDRFLVS